MRNKVVIFWFRRDLRLHDNAGLYHALRSGYPVVPVFIFDTNILDELEDKADMRVDIIHRQLEQMQSTLVSSGSTLQVLHNNPGDAFRELTSLYQVQAVYTNNDYEPYARERDEKIVTILQEQDINFHSYKDQVIFEKDEVLKDNGEPYTVYTPYSKKWKAKLNKFYMEPYPVEKYFGNFYKQPVLSLPSLKDIGFEPAEGSIPPAELDETVAKDYHNTRDIPSLRGTTRLSVHLRFGTVSIRQLVARAKGLNEKLLNELIWRDFYQSILWHFPHVVNHAFKKEYDNIAWRNNEDEFRLWCEGKTGYPIVDAGMRELNSTGYMHNRVRMIVASFLVKHLLIDWRWGEAYFAKKLLDFDLASNNGGWQWAAGSGCDAAPYFRIFNPYLQTQKFDPELKYIRKWVPEFEDVTKYPRPIVEHDFARRRCLDTFREVLSK
ncbi:MAG TPA: deoxyribodipyrimidine photo-lyase [Flavipsychrobacter sp.]